MGYQGDSQQQPVDAIGKDLLARMNEVTSSTTATDTTLSPLTHRLLEPEMKRILFVSGL
jgi:hypothetical protein